MPRTPRPVDAFRALGTILGAFAPATALADDAAVVPGLGWMALRAGASLALVLGLIVALAFLFRRLRAVQPATLRRLASLERLDLGAKREIRLVKVDDRVLLIGVTGEHISLLSELPGDAGEANDSAPLASGLRVLRKLTSSS